MGQIYIFQILVLGEKTVLKINKTGKFHTDWVWTVAYAPENSFLVTGSFDKTIIIWNAATLTLFDKVTHHTDKVRIV